MNLLKLVSVALSVVFVSLLTGQESSATSLFHPLHIFTAAKLGTMGLIGKGAILAPLVVKKVAIGGAVVAGGIAGAKTGLLASSLKAPLFLAKSSLPNLISLAPLLKGLGKKSTKKSAPVAAAPLPPPPPPMLPPPPPPVKASYAPSYPPMAPSYAPMAPSYAPMAPTYSQPIIRSGY